MGSKDPLSADAVEVYKSMADRTGAGPFNSHDVLRLVATIEARDQDIKNMEARLKKTLGVLNTIVAQQHVLLPPLYKNEDPMKGLSEAKKDPKFKPVIDAFLAGVLLLGEEKVPS